MQLILKTADAFTLPMKIHYLCHGNTSFLQADKDSLFVPSAIHFEIVYLRPDKPAVVPCRVTEPRAKVTLHREVPPEEITANGTLVSYDPTRGFVLQHPTPEHQGVFYCKAVSKGTPQISTKYQLLYVEGEYCHKFSDLCRNANHFPVPITVNDNLSLCRLTD